MYWQSLRYGCGAGASLAGRCHSLFVHVPPFAVVCEAEQRRFVLAALGAVANAAAAEVVARR